MCRFSKRTNKYVLFFKYFIYFTSRQFKTPYYLFYCNVQHTWQYYNYIPLLICVEIKLRSKLFTKSNLKYRNVTICIKLLKRVSPRFGNLFFQHLFIMIFNKFYFIVIENFIDMIASACPLFYENTFEILNICTCF